MKKTRLVIMVVCLTLLLMACGENMDTKATEAKEDSLTESQSNQDANQAKHTYSLNMTAVEGKGYSQDHIDDYTKKIGLLYDDLADLGFDIPHIDYKMTSFSRITKDSMNPNKNTILFNPDGDHDQDLIFMVLKHLFPDDAHYGLLYGLSHHVSIKADLKLEDLETYSYEDIRLQWPNLYLTYVNFSPDLASPDEINMAKSLSLDFTNYIIETKGMDYLISLLKDDPDATYEVLLNQWTQNKEWDLAHEKLGLKVNWNSPRPYLDFEALNNSWSLFLSGEDYQGGPLYDRVYYPAMNESVTTYYDTLHLFSKEINRLEGVIGFDNDQLKGTHITIYYNDIPYTGLYQSDFNVLKLNSVAILCHEYVHYVDRSEDLIKRPLDLNTFPAIMELRATYLSLDKVMYPEVQGQHMIQSVPLYTKLVDKEDLVKVCEDYYNRPFDNHMYQDLFSDLIAYHYYKKHGQVFDTYTYHWEGGYPLPQWFSLSNFLVRSYGFEAFNTITLRDELPDGTPLTLDSVISDWEDYIKNLSPEVYQ